MATRRKLDDIFRAMETQGSSQKRGDQPVTGRVPLDQIEYGSAKFYMIGGMKWTVHVCHSITHNFNQIRISTDSLKTTQHCRVGMQVYAPKCNLVGKSFWHLFDSRRNTFCIPYPDIEQQENKPDTSKIKPTEGTLDKKLSSTSDGPYIRFTVNPKEHFHPTINEWDLRNPEFPFADLKLRVGKKDIMVNKKILSATSRFFMYIIGGSRVKMMKHMEVLYVKDVEFEDLYDLIGYIYNDWQFDFKRALRLQDVAERFGVMLHANNAEDFEARTSMEYLSRRCYDGIARDSKIMWQEMYISSNGETSDTSVFEKSDDEEEDGDGEEQHPNSEHDNDVEMMEHPNSPQIVSNASSMSGSPPPSPDPLVVNRDFSQQFDLGPRVPRQRQRQRQRYDEMTSISSLDLTDPPEQMAPGPPLFDEFAPVYPPNNPYLIETRQGQFCFSFDLHWDGSYTRGHKEAVSTSFGRWDIFLYRRSINDNEYLSLGIYINELSTVCNYDTEIRIQIYAPNQKPFMKIMEKIFNCQQNTLGYPTFMQWGEALSMTENGKLKVMMYVVLKVTDMPMPVMHYDEFPGLKDVFVKVEDTVCPVSRDILSDASPVLKEMFESSFIIDRSKVYTIPDMNYNHFIQILDLTYNRITNIPSQDLEPLMRLAIRFKMQFIIDQLCREVMDSSRSFSDKEIFQFAKKYNLNKIMYISCNQQKFYNINRSEPLLRQ